MTKTFQEQEDEQGYSVDENTYFHPATGLNGLTIIASSSIQGLDAMLGKRITNTRPSSTPARRKMPNNSSHAPVNAQHPLQNQDANASIPSAQRQQETHSTNCTDQHSEIFARKAPRILPPRNTPTSYKSPAPYKSPVQQHNRASYTPPAQQHTAVPHNQFTQHNQSTPVSQSAPVNPSPQHSQPAQRNQQRTYPLYHSSQASSRSNEFSIPVPASATPTRRIIPPPPVENSWTKKPTKIASSLDDIPLTQEQAAIVDSVIRGGKSIYLTGTAGTGKSVVLRAIVKGLYTKYGVDSVAVTASTGLAACHIGGVTLHSEMGIGVGEKSAEDYYNTLRKQGATVSKMVKLKVLIIDEISMIDADLFDKISVLTGKLRKKEEAPFGGIQLVVCGDFYQLPPVNKTRSTVKYAFEARCWKEAIHETMTLTRPFRQTDEHFTKILNELKRGIVSEESIKEIQRLDRPLPNDNGIEPTQLYPLRKELNTANAERLAALSGEALVYPSRDSGSPFLLKKCIAPPEITLKVDAQVMLIKNLTPTLVNGARGVVKEFRVDESGKAYPVVKFRNGETLVVTPHTYTFDAHGHSMASRTQIPLILAWALSIHKSQGQTIDYLVVDLKNCFDSGHAYVALSRARSMDNLRVINFSKRVVKVNNKVIKFYEEEEQKRLERVGAK